MTFLLHQTRRLIWTAGFLLLVAFTDCTAANISTDTGKLSIVADGNVDLTMAHENDSSYKEVYNKKKGFLSSKSKLNIDQSQSDTAVGNTLSADSISILAGRDLTATGASVVATNEVSLSAARDVTIRSAESTSSESHLSQTKKSGVFGSGGIGITVGSQKLNSNNAQQTTTQTASAVGSLTGDVNITAGRDAHVTASDLIAGQDVNVTGRNVTLDTANDTTAQQSETKFKQSGLSISLNAPLIQTAQAATAAAERATEVKDPKLKALYALRAAQNAVKTAEAAQEIIKSGDPASAFSLSVSIGSSKSQSSSSSAESTAKGSSLTAGRDINLVATGDAASGNGDVNMIGAAAQAARDINLAANRDVNLLSAANQSSSQSSNKSSSASLGVAFSVTGPSLIANASAAKGGANGADLTHTETTLKAGDTLSLDAGRDATLKGAVANGNTVIADVGRNLTLQSEQDSSTYTARQRSAGVGLSVGLDGKVGGNVSAGQSKTDSTYQSVIEQTAINAGSGGFDINVNGNTHLGGAIVNSTAPAESNQLTTGTLTTGSIENRGQYSASSANVGLNVGGSLATGTDKPAGGSKGGSGLDAGLGGMAVADSGEASGTTKAAISAATITITDEGKQTELTGTTAAETVAQLNRDTANANGSVQNPFNQQQVAEQLEFLQVLGEDVVKPVAAQAAKWIGDQFPPDPNDPTRIDPAKVAAHAALGAAMSTILGTGWESGAAAGALGDVLPNLLTKAFETDPATGKPKNEEAFKAANAIIAALLASAAGADAAQIINAGMIAKNAVENNYLKHTEIIQLIELQNKKLSGKCDASCEQALASLAAKDNKRDADLAACDGKKTAQCNLLRQEVRSAYAEILRSPAIYDFTGINAINDTKDQADNALGSGQAAGFASGAAHVVNTFFKDVKEFLLGDGITNLFFPDQEQGTKNAKLLEKLTDSQFWEAVSAMPQAYRNQMADAYERGDAIQVGRLTGILTTNIATLIPGGAIGSLKKVEGFEQAVAAAELEYLKSGTSPVDVLHTLGADYTRTGRPTGGHSLLTGDVRIVPGTESVPDANGVYQATVQMLDPKNPGQWITKTTKSGDPLTNTMFPKDWSAAKIQAEIDSAWNATDKQAVGDKWSGTSRSGVKIEGYTRPRATAYPVYTGR